MSGGSALAATTHHSVSPQAVTHIRPAIGQPAGCPAGDFCAYSKTNGGNLCYTMSKSGSLGSCGSLIQSSYNYNGSQSAQLFYSASYGGASYCLGPGDYLLYMSQNTFNKGSGKAGYGKPLDNHVLSMKFVSSC